VRDRLGSRRRRRRLGGHERATIPRWRCLTLLMNHTTQSSLRGELRRLLFPWGFALLLPMPMLMAGSEHPNSDIAVLYLALGAAWLATETFHPAHPPASLAQWRNRMGALLIYLSVNALVFSLFGSFAGVASNIPLPILATLGIAPSLGLVPWLTLRLRQPYAAIVLGAFAVALIKLAACVVARLVYGPDYLAQGYASADWRTAKLMISLMWIGTLLVSALAFLACHRRFARS
jgi:hypothetical protein